MKVQNLYNPFVKLLLRSPLHSVIGEGVMLIQYTGKRSGKPHTVPVNYLRDGDVLWTISQRERVWWRNLRGGARVTVLIDGQEAQGMGDVIADDESVAASLMDYLRKVPQLAKYIGVRLDPAGTPAADDVTRAARCRVMVRIELAADGAEACARPEGIGRRV
ncbi:MAG: nitroreductase family deazaflavin-dependent oxidoreductase [Chloroflexi bacterium]|nr:nitroreductase family deazaflavin-dependent oxidoreductase [Chloroflexota bacterium]